MRARFFSVFILNFLFLTLFAGSALGEVSVETSVSRSILNVGDQLTLDIIVTDANGPVSKPNFSKIEGFSSYSQGHSQEISIVNGRTTSRSIFSYLMIANTEGKKTIGPFEVKIGEKYFQVAPVEVEVLPYRAPGPAQGASSRQGVTAPHPRALPKAGVSNQDIFVKAWLDKDEVYVNEPAILTYTIYTRLSATYKGFEEEPDTTGFWVEDFPPEDTARKQEKMINGSRYVVADVRKQALFPTQAGVFTIKPGVLAATVEVRGRDDFDSFFSVNVFGSRRRRLPSSFMTQRYSKTLPADEVSLLVKTLPEEGKPANFSGAVGNYRITSSVDKDRVEEGEPVTLRIRVTGEGNINTLELPRLPAMEDFKVYESSSSVNISKKRLLVEGEKVTETVLVPKKEGTYTIPPLHFSYFDPRKKAYQSIRTVSHRLKVDPGPEEEVETRLSAPPAVLPGQTKEAPAILDRDIRYIHKVRGKKPPQILWYRQWFYWLANALLGAGVFYFLFLGRRGAPSPEHSRAHRLKRSHKAARRKLKKAARFLKKGDEDAFYAELSKTIHGYFADKLDRPSQSIDFNSVQTVLEGRSVPKELLDSIEGLFGDLNLGRFGRSGEGAGHMKDLYEKAGLVITQFEKVKIK